MRNATRKEPRSIDIELFHQMAALLLSLLQSKAIRVVTPPKK